MFLFGSWNGFKSLLVVIFLKMSFKISFWFKTPSFWLPQEKKHNIQQHLSPLSSLKSTWLSPLSAAPLARICVFLLATVPTIPTTPHLRSSCTKFTPLTQMLGMPVSQFLDNAQERNHQCMCGCIHTGVHAHTHTHAYLTHLTHHL